MKLNFDTIFLAFAMLLIFTAPAFAYAPVSAPEPVSTSLFLLGGGVMIAVKRFHKK